jgi:diguanylate cyclase (GGDEF)-like protein/PAS domain S-box-containing protein
MSGLRGVRDWGLRTVALVGIIGLVASGAAWLGLAHYWDARSAQEELNALGDNRRLRLQEGLTDVEQMLHTVRDYLESEDKGITIIEFQEFVDRVTRVYDGAVEIDWAPRVRRGERLAFERNVREHEITGYRIQETGPDGVPGPSGEREEYFPILYVAGRLRASDGFGLDVLSDAMQRAALERARDTGGLAATPIVRLQSLSGPRGAVFVMVPVYALDPEEQTLAGRRASLIGVIRAVILPGQMLEGLFRSVKPRGLDIQFFRDGAYPGELPFHVRSSLLRTSPVVPRPRGELEAGLHWTGEVRFADARWTMIVVPIAGGPLLIEHSRAWIAFPFGLSLTAAAVLYAWLNGRHTARLRRLMADLGESRQALAENEAKLSTILDAVHAGVVIIDPESHRIVDVNPAAAALIGATRESIVGASCQKFICPADVGKCPITDLGQTVDHSERVLLTAAGSAIPILKTVTKLTLGGKPHLIESFLDISDLKYRGALLHGIAVAATELLAASDLEASILGALKLIGEIVRVDRIVVLELLRPAAAAPRLAVRYAWNSAAAPVHLDPATFKVEPGGLQFDPWLAPLGQGQAVSGVVTELRGPMRVVLERLGVVSILLVPLMIDGKYWGQIEFDDCRLRREWTPDEADILRILANLIGASIVRARYVQELTDANTIVERSPTILFRLGGDPALPMTYVSRNIKQFGRDAAEMVEVPLLYQQLIHPDDEARVREAMVQALSTGSSSSIIEFRMRRGDESYRWIEVRYSPVHDAGGRLLEIEGILVDVTERKAAEQKITLLARTDPLTGLANRATFTDRLRQAFLECRRGSRPFAILYLDLDRFKDVNDTLGHPVGDQLLRAVAERIVKGVRETDLVARLGGDEFAVLQSDLNDTSDSGTCAAQIRAALARPWMIDGNELHVTASIGISIYAPETKGPDDLLAQADMALYRAKEAGRDQYRFHSEELDQQVRERIAMSVELRNALDRGEFELIYQPQVELASGRIVGMEALIRWHHPARGEVLPSEFIPVAERTGTMIAIGQWVLDRACGQMSAWRSAGIAPPTIAVNISAVQLKSPGEFIQLIGDTLAKWNVAPAELELDVTESMLAQATLAQNDVLERLRALGVKIAIDDFGTKYSSLEYLRTYRVSRLKIPRMIVDGATRDSSSAAMMRAIIGIARELKVEVIAQGVETQSQWSLLSEASPAPKVQGYYYSKPVAAARASELLRRGRIEPSSKPQSLPALV